jgi:hypothetical protein
VKELRKASAQATKDFGRLVKAFVKGIAKGHANAAYVTGYMDVITGTSRSFSGLPDASIAEYTKGWQAAVGANPKQPKRKKA